MRDTSLVLCTIRHFRVSHTDIFFYFFEKFGMQVYLGTYYTNSPFCRHRSDLISEIIRPWRPMSKKLLISVSQTDVCEIGRSYYVLFTTSEFHKLTYLWRISRKRNMFVAFSASHTISDVSLHDTTSVNI